MTGSAWSGYGTPADPEQWRLAAEWLLCACLHGGQGEIEAEATRIGISVTAMIVMVDACVDALHNGADRVESGDVLKACCPERQRSNRAYALRQREAKKPS